MWPQGSRSSSAIARMACSTAGEQPSLAIDPAHVRGKHQAKTPAGFEPARNQDRFRRHASSASISRCTILARQAPDMRLRAGHEFPSAEIVGRTRKGANALGRQQVGLDRRGDAAGDLILHGEDVAELAVVSFSPVMGAGQRVDELGADAQRDCHHGARCLPARSARQARARPASRRPRWPL